ncbi:MAG TPA: ABC transporter permease [Candidatus Acidoferrales bacterium]|nr:ABC transporter permease [Candidatus Acidoferrales bacterium]
MPRLFALLLKEFRQMRHDRRIVFISIVAPFVQLVVFGFVLSADVTNLPLGIVDDSRTPQSRNLIEVMTHSESFRLAGYYDSTRSLGDAIAAGKIDAGLVIPYDYAKQIVLRKPTQVQILLDATNANVADIGQGYAESVVSSLSNTLGSAPATASVQLVATYVNNPGLVDSWFMVTGILGILLILNGSMISSTMMIKERSAGTLEQLLMSPASTTEIIVSKVVPIFVLLAGMAIVSMAAIHWMFGVPVHGSVTVVVLGIALCMLCGIALGMFVATLAKNALQAQLAVFFINPPLATLSGAFTPIEAMPKWLQPLTIPNPIANFAAIARGALIRGVDLSVLWPNFAWLGGITFALLIFSIVRYRRQLL